MKTFCKIDKCMAKENARGLCSMHFSRLRRYGDPLFGPPPKARKTEIDAFITQAISHAEDECLLWPFTRDACGYGRIFRGQKSIGVHRLVCVSVHGQPPSERHEAAHSCGKGHEGCVSPKHLRWATHKENNQDKILHGTNKAGENSCTAKLTPNDVALIRATPKYYGRLRDLCLRFSISKSAILAIDRGESWR